MKTSRLLTFCLALLACLLSAACERRQPTPQTLPPAVITALETAYNRNDAEACAAVFAEDGAVLPDNAPILNGKAAIAEYFRDNVNRDLTYDTHTTLNVVRGDFAFEQGTYRVRNIAQGRDVEVGKYLNVFKKVNGEWKIYRNIWNTDEATPAAAISPAEPSAPE